MLPITIWLWSVTVTVEWKIDTSRDTSNTELSGSIKEVQNAATTWQWMYNHERPNMALGGFTSAEKLAAYQINQKPLLYIDANNGEIAIPTCFLQKIDYRCSS